MRVFKVASVYFISGILWVGFSILLIGKKDSDDFNILIFFALSFLLFLVISSIALYYNFQNYLTISSQDSTKMVVDFPEKSELEANNERLVEIIENTSDLIGITNMYGEGIYLNKAGMKMMEIDEVYRPKERKFSDVHPPQVQELIRKVAIPYAIKNGNWRGETSFISRSGKIIPTSQVVSVHKGKDGTPQYISTIARDISKEKESEIRLTESIKINQIFYKSLANSPLVMIFWSYKDGKTKVLDWNSVAENVIGYSAAETIGNNFYDFVAPDRKEEVIGLVDLVVKNMIPRNFETPAKSKSGKKLILNWFITPIRDPSSDTIYILALAEDITEKMTVQERLKEKEQRWLLVLNGNNDGIYDWNIKTDEIFFSDRYKEILGFEPHEPPNTTKEAGEMIHPDDFEMVSKNAYDYLAKKIPAYQFEHRERCKDGTYKWVLNRGLAVWDDDGNPIRMIGSRTDITERKKIENHLRMIESVVYHVNDGVVITEVTNEENGKPRIIYINKSFTKITGYTSEETIGKVPGLLAGAKTNPLILSEIFEFIKLNKEGYKNELIVYHKDGRSFWIEFSIDPVLNDNTVNYWVWTFRDITKRKEAEEELKKINFELDSFVYRASHDLRAPLTSIIGLVNISSTENDINVIQNYFKLISDSVKKLDQYIINLLSLSRNSRLEVSSVEINFEEIINECFEELRYMKNADLIKLSVNVTGRSNFYSDSLRLKVIFKNLLSNAIKYQNTKLDSSFLDIQINIAEAHAEIHLVDNGIGIPDNIKDRVFDMFFRGTETSDGSGLGLYIVKNVLEKLNGAIKISSNHLEGCNIFINVPNQNS